MSNRNAFFTIEINRVFLHKQVDGRSYPVEKEFVRGDLVYGVRQWHKSERDNDKIEGEMCEVTVRDPANANLRVPFQKYQVAESATAFNDRLNAAARDARDATRHITAEQGS